MTIHVSCLSKMELQKNQSYQISEHCTKTSSGQSYVRTPETSPDIQAKIDQLSSIVSNLSSCVSKLANNAQAVTQVITSSPNEPPRAPTTSNTNVIGMPAVSNLENCKVNQGLQQRNILWTRVHLGGIDLPLHIDSCCSVSLVRRTHTDHLLKTNSQLRYTTLPDPIPVAVTNPTAQLKAIGTMEVPLDLQMDIQPHS